MKQNTFLLVPARGGSKGIPKRNLREVVGIPLVARAVRTALEAAGALGVSRDHVVCTTDDAEIARVVRKWGGSVPFVRPERLASDTATALDVVFHAVEALGLSEEDIVAVRQPTSPFVAAEDVLATLALCLTAKLPVGAFRISEEWIDVGQRPELSRARGMGQKR